MAELSFPSLPGPEQQITSNLGVSQWRGGGGAGNQDLKLKERMANKERPGRERGVKGWGSIVEFFISEHALGSAQDGIFSKSLGCPLNGIYRSAGIEYWRVPKARRTLSVLCYVMLMRMMPKSSQFGKRLKCFQFHRTGNDSGGSWVLVNLPYATQQKTSPVSLSLSPIIEINLLHRPCRVYSKRLVYVSSLYI